MVDAKELNTHIGDLPFLHSESPVRILQDIATYRYCAQVDLRDGFYHVAMADNVRNYLAVKYKGRYFRYRVLPQGLKVAPGIFAKFMEQLALSFSPTNGVLTRFYQDNIFLFGDEELHVHHDYQRILAELQHLGFKINWDKSFSIYEDQEILGLLRTSQGEWKIPSDKKEELIRLVHKSWQWLQDEDLWLARIPHLIGKWKVHFFKPIY